MHIACQLGNWEFIDIVLDIEGVEIDPQNREGETPLHLAVKYTNNGEPEHGYFIIDNLLDAGSDPRIKDKFNLKPKDYVDKDHQNYSSCWKVQNMLFPWNLLRRSNWLNLKIKVPVKKTKVRHQNQIRCILNLCMYRLYSWKSSSLVHIQSRSFVRPTFQFLAFLI